MREGRTPGAISPLSPAYAANHYDEDIEQTWTAPSSPAVGCPSTPAFLAGQLLRAEVFQTPMEHFTAEYDCPAVVIRQASLGNVKFERDEGPTANEYSTRVAEDEGPRRSSMWRRVSNQLATELYITGEALAGTFAPAPPREHWRLFSPFLLIAFSTTFFCMAGQYMGYGAITNADALACLRRQRNDGAAFGVRAVVRQFVFGAASDYEWCYGSPKGEFDGHFLIEWGARWAPAMRRQPQRWITSAFLHQGFMHLLSNSVLLLLVGLHLERKYGAWVAAAGWTLATVAANGLSAATENACIAVVGASGGVFGLSSLWMADFALNFRTVRRPVMSAILMVCFVASFAATLFVQRDGTSHMSHVGGLLAGAFVAPALLWFPGTAREKRGWKEAVAAAGVGAAATLLASTLAVFYLKTLPAAACKE